MSATFTGDTKLVGRVGEKPSMSGKNIYMPLFEHIGYDGVYLQFVVPAESTKAYLESVKALGILGSSVTGEHTHNLMELVDEIDETAKVTNHGNCLVNKGGHTTLHSTDVAGMMRSIQSKVDSLSGKRIVVLGGGALMPGLLHELKKHETGTITIFNRTVSKVEQLAKDYGIKVGGGLEDLVKSGEGEIFINASDLGAEWCETQDTILTDEFLQRFEMLQDCTFMPYTSNWSLRAEKLGKKVGFGYEMFAHQGAEQLRLIAGLEPDMNFMIPLVKKGLGG